MARPEAWTGASLGWTRQAREDSSASSTTGSVAYGLRHCFTEPLTQVD